MTEDTAAENAANAFSGWHSGKGGGPTVWAGGSVCGKGWSKPGIDTGGDIRRKGGDVDASSLAAGKGHKGFAHPFPQHAHHHPHHHHHLQQHGFPPYGQQAWHGAKGPAAAGKKGGGKYGGKCFGAKGDRDAGAPPEKKPRVLLFSFPLTAVTEQMHRELGLVCSQFGQVEKSSLFRDSVSAPAPADDKKQGQRILVQFATFEGADQAMSFLNGRSMECLFAQFTRYKREKFLAGLAASAAHHPGEAEVAGENPAAESDARQNGAEGSPAGTGGTALASAEEALAEEQALHGDCWRDAKISIIASNHMQLSFTKDGNKGLCQYYSALNGRLQSVLEQRRKDSDQKPISPFFDFIWGQKVCASATGLIYPRNSDADEETYTDIPASRGWGVPNTEPGHCVLISGSSLSHRKFNHDDMFRLSSMFGGVVAAKELMTEKDGTSIIQFEDTTGASLFIQHLHGLVLDGNTKKLKIKLSTLKNAVNWSESLGHKMSTSRDPKRKPNLLPEKVGPPSAVLQLYDIPPAVQPSDIEEAVFAATKMQGRVQINPNDPSMAALHMANNRDGFDCAALLNGERTTITSVPFRFNMYFQHAS
ncbi:hypothetical protein DIPPA_22124 [Diplonema papillatum]|nr:hypothetical protein DIPPA_22124 [Diplonema papillatum]